MSFRGGNQSNFCCSNQIADYRPRSIRNLDRKTNGKLYAERLFKSVQKYAAEFNSKWESENIDGVVGTGQFQWNFWNEKISEIQLENEKVFVAMNAKSGVYSAETIEMCYKKIYHFYRMAEMYNHSICNEILQRKFDKSELSVLIGLEEIQKYRCRKFLKLWKIISLNHQRTATNTNLKNGSNDPEALITRHVREFLNVIYEMR